MTTEIILYDLPSKGPKPTCWSLNPWKARLALNYKRLPYRTQWTEYPAIRPLFQSLNIPPNSPDLNPLADYSCPAIQLPNGEYVMDSLAIAHALEKIQPGPSLHLNSEYVARAQAIVAEIWKGLSPIALPRVPEMLLNEESAVYFRETREKRFGKPLSRIATEVDVEAAWKTAELGLVKLRAMLEEHEKGPFVMGKEVGFADFVIVGMWHFARKVEVNGDLFGRGVGFDEAFRAQYEACEGWFGRED